MATKDKGQEQAEANAVVVEEALQAALSPRMGQQVMYQVHRGHRIPMLITAVHLPDLIDGVAFSARPSDVGNTYGSRGYQRIKRGDGDGQWQI